MLLQGNLSLLIGREFLCNKKIERKLLNKLLNKLQGYSITRKLRNKN